MCCSASPCYNHAFLFPYTYPEDVIYGNACNLHNYYLNRDPGFNAGIKFCVDRFYWVNHKSKSYSDVYFRLHYSRTFPIYSVSWSTRILLIELTCELSHTKANSKKFRNQKIMGGEMEKRHGTAWLTNWKKGHKSLLSITVCTVVLVLILALKGILHRKFRKSENV